MKRLHWMLVFVVILSDACAAQTYPNKPVKLVVPNAPGQAADIIGRYYAEAFTHELGQQVIVENRAGAGGNIGTAAVARAPADGYTLLVGNGATHALNPAMYKDPGYDPERDFEPIGMMGGRVVMAIAVRPETGIKSLADLMAASKTSPILVGIPSTMANLVQELLTKGGASIRSVPYKGSAAAVNDILGDHVAAIIDTATALQPHVNAGNVVAVGVTSLTESDALPGVQPVAKQGLAGFEVTGWYALFAPKGTPAVIIDQLNAALNRIQDAPETKVRLRSLGLDFNPVGSPQQLAQYVRSEREKWYQVIKAANITAD